MIGKKVGYYVLQFLAGTVFILSAWYKLLPVEPMEFSIVETGLVNWSVVPYLSRFLISLEFMTGFFLILNLYRRVFIRLSLALLAVFSLYLVILWAKLGNVENCHCFGSHLEFSPLESLIKNTVLAVVILLVSGKPSLFTIPRLKPLIAVVMIVGTLAFPHIIEPTDAYWGYRPDASAEGKELDIELMGADHPEIASRLSRGKQIIAFYSTSCPFCRLSARKLSIMDDNTAQDLPVHFVFFGDEARLELFYEKSMSSRYPATFIDTDTFFKIAGGMQVPRIYLIENGIVKKKLGFRTLEFEYVKRFMEQGN